MNPNFQFVPFTRSIKGVPVNHLRVVYIDQTIAVFSEGDRKASDTRTLEEMATEYVVTYGHAAEHRRQWNKGNRINWSDDLKVDIGFLVADTLVEVPGWWGVHPKPRPIECIESGEGGDFAGAGATSSWTDSISEAVDSVGDGISSVADGVGEVIGGIADGLSDI